MEQYGYKPTQMLSELAKEWRELGQEAGGKGRAEYERRAAALKAEYLTRKAAMIDNASGGGGAAEDDATGSVSDAFTTAGGDEVFIAESELIMDAAAR